MKITIPTWYFLIFRYLNDTCWNVYKQIYLSVVDTEFKKKIRKRRLEKNHDSHTLLFHARHRGKIDLSTTFFWSTQYTKDDLRNAHRRVPYSLRSRVMKRYNGPRGFVAWSWNIWIAWDREDYGEAT